MGEKKYLACAIFLAVISGVLSQDAPDCIPANCTLPECRCSGSDIPGNLNATNIPQLVFLSFDAAVNVDNFAFYNEVLFGRKNPNNQSISMTFFVSHDYTNYTMVHEMWRLGHEIGLHSISSNPSQAYWQNLTETGWRQELIDQRTQLNTFGRVPATEIVGARAPQLAIGGDQMYKVLLDAKLTYDSSRPTQTYRTSGLWPYTNDFKSVQDCPIPRCPTQIHKGFWTVPLINMVSSDGRQCSLADQCVPVPETAAETLALLKSNFEVQYTGNRSPFGIFTRHGWVNGTGDEDDGHIWERRLGYIQFLDYLKSLPDVYIVSIAKGLEWVKTPKTTAQSATFAPFRDTPRTSLCPKNFECPYSADQTPFKPPESQTRYFNSCVPCPAYYPWVGNPVGRNPYNKK